MKGEQNFCVQWFPWQKGLRLVEKPWGAGSNVGEIERILDSRKLKGLPRLILLYLRRRGKKKL